jgi:phage gp29-like protein
VFETREPADLTAFSQSLERLVNAGMGAHIPVAWVREQAGIP